MTENGLTLLVVEDDFVDLEILKRSVSKREWDWNLVNQVDGASALQYLRSPENISIDLDQLIILLDINMPGMNGFELASQIRQKHPATGIIYVTGYADNPAFGKQEMYGPILQKPVEPETLIATIRKLLARDTAE